MNPIWSRPLFKCSVRQYVCMARAGLHKVFRVCTAYCTTLPCKSVMHSVAVSWNQSGPCVWWGNLSSCRRGDTPLSAVGSCVLQKEMSSELYVTRKNDAFIDAPGSQCRNCKDIMYRTICLGANIKSRRRWMRWSGTIATSLTAALLHLT